MIRRYEYGAIAEVWVPSAVYERWHQIEVAHMRQVAGAEVAEALSSVRSPTPAQVNYYERETNHDVAAFLRALDANIRKEIRVGLRGSPELWAKVRSSLHYGLTSSDLVDTAQAMGLQECAPIVVRLAENLEQALFRFIDRIGVAETIGRTHGQLAAPMCATARWVVLAEMIGRTLTRVRTAFEWSDVGKLSGPVGEFDHGEGSALASLGLRDSAATQIVARDRLAHLANCLGLMVTVCEAIVTQVWLLNQQGIDEIRFLAPPSAVGSSAMPHKRNPITAENVRGLARMVRTLVDALQLGVVQWGEHDLAHSSVERVCVPDLLHLVCTALDRTAALMAHVIWQQPTIPKEYRDTSEDLRVLQAQGVPYVDAHAQLRDAYQDGKIPATTTEEDK